LLEWYDRYRRILPWRAMKGEMPDPYRVWLSEIMLQQTTVGAVGPYFRRFVNRWPTVAHLARARRGEILKMWAGLGYYRRAHLLHDCAKKIMCDYGGEFPRDEESLRALPGFGPYTAAALAAIAFDKRASAVDGNAERVMARLHAVRVPLPQAKPRLRMLAESMLPDARFGDYAQALMDLGATICTPRHPKCDLCPWMKDCCAHALGIAGNLPRRLKAKAKPVRRAIAFVALNGKGEVLLRRRPKDGLLGGMMEVPSSAWREDPMPTLAKAAKEAPGKARWRLVPGHVRHVFSHFELEMAVAAGHLAGADCGVWRPAKKLGGEALPSVMRKILRHAAAAGIIKLPFP
ncbi:MAG TPA: A/G-specific adenine glycosylase, partial [Alphaproteobacteria bacterium]|nr:A/G-specific adenine glycosylase [Alphaproteobacteria bacterium]